MKYDVFISYSRKDKSIADQICKAFEQAGISYFIDRDGILSGQDFVNVIIKAIKESTIFLFLASMNSYKSQITLDEVFEALDGVAIGNHQIITYILDDSELPNELRFRLRRYNWRNRHLHSIENVLVPDIKTLLHSENYQKLEKSGIETNKQTQRKDYTKKAENLDLRPFEGDNGKYGYRDYSDKQYKVVIPCKWRRAEQFYKGLAAVQDDTYKWGYIDVTGEVVIPCKWARAFPSFQEGLAAVQDDNGKEGFINQLGKLVIPCKWKLAFSFHDGLAPVMGDNDKWGYIDRSGKLVVPCVWEKADDFSEGLARVEDSKGGYGYINKVGSLIIPCKWGEARPFSGGVAKVGFHWLEYEIDKKGNIVNKLLR